MNSEIPIERAQTVADQLQIFVDDRVLGEHAPVMVVAGCLIGAGVELIVRNGGSVEHALQVVTEVAEQLKARSGCAS